MAQRRKRDSAWGEEEKTCSGGKGQVDAGAEGAVLVQVKKGKFVKVYQGSCKLESSSVDIAGNSSCWLTRRYLLNSKKT
jgi:hypothetical protein